jgi:hypothetical protein
LPQSDFYCSKPFIEYFYISHHFNNLYDSSVLFY